ncbi:hypothetical protein BH23THE1_BH23THE1_28970 [soil metagenome]
MKGTVGQKLIDELNHQTAMIGFLKEPTALLTTELDRSLAKTYDGKGVD